MTGNELVFHFRMNLFPKKLSLLERSVYNRGHSHSLKRLDLFALFLANAVVEIFLVKF